MKKTITYLFLFIYLFSFSEMREVLKLPILIEHFMEHREKTPEMSFSSFMDAHYFSGHEKDADYERDMQLPFKSAECNHLALNNIPLPLFFSFKVDSLPVFEEKQNNFSYSESVTVDNLHSIFRPPLS